MSNKLKSSIQWALFLLILLFVLFIIFVVVVETFCPESSIAGNFEKIIGRISIIVGFLSLGLGAWSIHLTHESNNQVAQILETVQLINNSQQNLERMLESGTPVIKSRKTKSKKRQWPQDDIKE